MPLESTLYMQPTEPYSNRGKRDIYTGELVYRAFFYEDIVTMSAMRLVRSISIPLRDRCELKRPFHVTCRKEFWIPACHLPKSCSYTDPDTCLGKENVTQSNGTTLIPCVDCSYNVFDLFEKRKHIRNIEYAE